MAIKVLQSRTCGAIPPTLVDVSGTARGSEYQPVEGNVEGYLEVLHPCRPVVAQEAFFDEVIADGESSQNLRLKSEIINPNRGAA